MKSRSERMTQEFSGELPEALVNYRIWTAIAVLPALLALGVAYLLGFDSTPGRIAAWIGIAITGLGIAIVSFRLVKARWNALDAVNQGQKNG